MDSYHKTDKFNMLIGHLARFMADALGFPDTKLLSEGYLVFYPGSFIDSFKDSNLTEDLKGP